MAPTADQPSRLEATLTHSAGTDAGADGVGQDRLQASPAACHGRCYGFEQQRDGWAAPRLVVRCDADARPGYSSMSASEFADDDEVLRGKVRALAELLRQARHCVVYSGAGLSTGAGIPDYASQSPDSLSCAGRPPPVASALLSPMCAQPTLSHRVLVALHKAGRMHRWVNQNHDGLPQKAGLPQEAINEIHGAWHAPDNPVVPMTGTLREDLFADLSECRQKADLTIAVGTSLCGMNADSVVTEVAQRAASRTKGSLGSVVIGLQRTVHDEEATLRIFARCDDTFAMLAEEMSLEAPAPSGEFFVPPVLVGRAEADYVFRDLPYDAAGNRITEDAASGARLTLDLRDDAELVITGGMHAGATGVVDGFDREGNVRCRFKLKPKSGTLRAQVQMPLGRWWAQAAVDGTVSRLPVVNPPEGSSQSAQRLLDLVSAYADP